MSDKTVPIPVKRALKSLGQNISAARRIRGWSQADFALRLDTSLSTVRRLESGFHGTGLQIFLRALHLLGLLDELVKLTAIESDELGLELLQIQLPKRVRSKHTARLTYDGVREESSSTDELEGF